MNFDNEKKQTLEKIDHSKKGSIDKQILSLIKKINSYPDYYTTSSCAGRILLIKKAEKKHEAEWLLSSHETVTYEEVKEKLNELPEKTVWFRMESPIIHLCTRTMEDADKIMLAANKAGLRRTGIISFRKRIVVELFIPEKMDVPISKDKKLLVDEDYLKYIIDLANNKLKKSRKRLKKFEKEFLSL